MRAKERRTRAGRWAVALGGGLATAGFFAVVVNASLPAETDLPPKDSTETQGPTPPARPSGSTFSHPTVLDDSSRLRTRGS